MTISSTTLRRIAAMPAEAMVEAILFLAEQREIAEVNEVRHAEIRRKDADRKRISKGFPAEVTPLARVIDITSTSKQEVSKKDSPPSPSKPLFSDPDGFAELWDIYPKRAGAADRKAAVKAFVAALRRIDLKTILDGARRYAAECKATNKTGTEFVKQLRTWLNADGWTETYESKSNDNFSSARDLLQRIGRA